jgi:hypothetical protein
MLAAVRITDVVIVGDFEDENKDRFIVRMTRATERVEVSRTWSVHDSHARTPVFPKLWQRELLRDKLHTAVAYVALTGGTEGFPEFDPLID